jgi:hypothetical protein
MGTVPLFAIHNNARRVQKRRKLLENLSDFEIRKNCGLDYQGVLDVIDIFEPIEGVRRSAIPLETKVITFLSYLRSGNFQWSLGTLSKTPQASDSKIIEGCTNLVLQSAADNINFPNNPAEINRSKLDFHGLCRTKGFPRILGIVDGTHIGIISPPVDEDRYVNRKNYHSINCQVVVDSEYKFTDIVAKWPGSTHDALMWRESSVRGRLSRGNLGDGWFIGENKRSCHEISELSR